MPSNQQSKNSHHHGHLVMDVSQVHPKPWEPSTSPAISNLLVPYHPKPRQRAHHQGKLTPTLGAKVKNLEESHRTCMGVSVFMLDPHR